LSNYKPKSKIANYNSNDKDGTNLLISFYLRKLCLLTTVFIFCCHLLNLASIALYVKNIHMSYLDVNMNYT